MINTIKNNSVHLETLTDLEKRLRKKKKLKIKWGIDPTAPDIHLGHSVVVNKINDFLKLGHEVVIIIGDFTAMIGDPTGRSKTRPRLTKEEVDKNAQTYINQVKKILVNGDIKIRHNSEWIGKLKMEELISYLSKFTVARILERDDFSKRYRNNEPIYMHEPLYILLQAYDSVAIEPDVELGGTDQLFNLLAGRELMKESGLDPQICLTMPLLTGIDGKLKMSKSYNNHIGITEDPFTVFSKVMSIPDELCDGYFKYVLNKCDSDLIELNNKYEGKPRDKKLLLGFEIVKWLHNETDAGQARDKWIKVFSQKVYAEPEKIITLQGSELKPEGTMWIVDLVDKTGIFKSRGEVRRIIQQGGVEINHKKKEDVDYNVPIGKETIVKIGKRKRVFKFIIG